MEAIYFNEADHASMKGIQLKVGDLNVLPAILYHANLNILSSSVESARQSARLTENGGRDPRKKACVFPTTFRRLFEIANTINPLNDAFLHLLQEFVVPHENHAIPGVFLQPCKFVAVPRRSVKKGDIVPFKMDSLVVGNDVTVTAMDANDVDLPDPAPQTKQADDNGDAYIEMIVPAGYAGNKMKFRIDKDVVKKDEFGAGKPDVAIDSASEVHSVTVTP